MNDPLAYFITWTTYGTWLPGDARGWAKKKTWGVQLPNPDHEEHARTMMTEEKVLLTDLQRQIADKVIVDHCQIRHWILHARNVRTNHVHVVVTTETGKNIIREQLKAWASRRLSEQAGLLGQGRNGQRRWWTEKGDIELVFDERHLEEVIKYVVERQ